MIINTILCFKQKNRSLHWAHLCEKNKNPKHHIVWSDGCATHFKGSCSWLYTVRYHSLTIDLKLLHGCPFDWHYWSNSHGKGPHKGVKACLENAL